MLYLLSKKEKNKFKLKLNLFDTMDLLLNENKQIINNPKDSFMDEPSFYGQMYFTPYYYYLVGCHDDEFTLSTTREEIKVYMFEDPHIENLFIELKNADKLYILVGQDSNQVYSYWGKKEITEKNIYDLVIDYI